MEELKLDSKKLCENSELDDFDCIDCSHFDGCQMVLYDSYDELEGSEEHEDCGLSVR